MIVLTNIEDMSAPQENGWIVIWEESAKAVSTWSSGSFVGLPVKIDYISPKKVKREKWTIKKLAYELLPDRLLSALSAAANTARKALTAANAAQSTADAAQSTADAAQSTADAAQSTAETAVKPSKSGEDTCYYDMYNPYADYKPTTVSIGTRGGTALCIEVNKGSYPSAVFKPPVYGSRQADFEFQRATSAYHHPLITGIGGIVVYSSTPQSTKKFKITVDDSGALSATEVTDTTT